ncbi:MAG: peptide deformylase [Elusimicrobiota bacterium]|jgi:peptide deformylase
MILKAAVLGHPVLRARAEPVEAKDLRKPALKRLIEDMADTLFEYNGVGLAAPQVHASLRLFLALESADGMDEEDGPSAGAKAKLRVIANPEFYELSKEMEEGPEGCLSVPRLRGLVPRHTSLIIRGLDGDGRPLELAASGFFARVLQHEADHLDGLVYLDRMKDLRSLAFTSEL